VQGFKITLHVCTTTCPDGEHGSTCMCITPKDAWKERYRIFNWCRESFVNKFGNESSGFSEYCFTLNTNMFRTSAAWVISCGDVSDNWFALKVQLLRDDIFELYCDHLPMPAYYVCADICLMSRQYCKERLKDVVPQQNVCFEDWHG
jgi:hypothetical protein